MAREQLQMEVDTGVIVSVIVQKTIQDQFPDPQCEPSDVVLSRYRFQLSKVQGNIFVVLRFLKKKKKKAQQNVIVG